MGIIYENHTHDLVAGVQNNSANIASGVTATVTDMPPGAAIVAVPSHPAATIAGNVVSGLPNVAASGGAGDAYSVTIRASNPSGNVGAMPDVDVTFGSAETDTNIGNNVLSTTQTSWREHTFITSAESESIIFTLTKPPGPAAVWYDGVAAKNNTNFVTNNNLSIPYGAGAGNKTAIVWEDDQTTEVDCSACKLVQPPDMRTWVAATELVCDDNPIIAIPAGYLEQATLTRISLRRCSLTTALIAAVVDQVHAFRASYTSPLTLEIDGATTAANANAAPNAATVAKLADIRTAGHTVNANFMLDMTTTKSGSFTPSAVVETLAFPQTEALWDMGDGTELPGLNQSHTFADATLKTVRFWCNKADTLIRIDINNDELQTFDWEGEDLISLTDFDLSSNQLTALPARLANSTLIESYSIDRNAGLTTVIDKSAWVAIRVYSASRCDLPSDIDFGSVANLLQYQVERNFNMTSAASGLNAPVLNSYRADFCNLSAVTLGNNPSLVELFLNNNALINPPDTAGTVAMVTLRYNNNPALQQPLDSSASAVLLDVLANNCDLRSPPVVSSPRLRTLRVRTNALLDDLPDPSGWEDIRTVEANICALTLANQIQFMSRLHTNWANYNFATPRLTINGGTNATLDGVFADEDPPITGNGFRFELSQDPEATGNNAWTITANT